MEKKIVFWIFLGLGLVLFGVYLAVNRDYGDEFIPFQETRSRWGSKHFDPYKFRDGDEKVRAPMVTEILLRKLYLNENVAKVKEDLGAPTGFYSETAAAYIIQNKTSDINEIWQLVFIPDEHGTVTDIQVHKKCCIKDPWLKLFEEKK